MKDNRLYLIHISESIERIESYTEGLKFSDFAKQTLIQDAVLRNLQTLAESTQRLSDTFKTDHPQIEWYKIAGLRNILVHDYLGIDIETVWSAIKNNIPELKEIILKSL
ncbi:HepT-like ribonuclease domain-containing protein [Desulfobotulus mexicanus]|uniref:DUF86 domain-containing protein n=1 Tax=Desulfobotulus mexicanus TaxID=2586642 RepID=A0A5Q4VH07_9BACT|nr:DUF86 domain-containing protein [Desulfobotulus mexicanus]TYT76136.1 DUF86 domain-containing protein [Desulfobotulus mexicanus]